MRTHAIPDNATSHKALDVEVVGMTMRFGRFVALDNVSIKIAAGSFHALLGENGAGKSTLVKCIMGYHRASAGALLVNGREVDIGSPRVAASLGLGMVYQHFTLVPSLSGAENLVIARPNVPAVISWRKERAQLDAFMATMPFALPLDVPVRQLAAGEKQKLEILKQLYLGRRFLVLDEPTSVLTPAEAQDVLAMLRSHTRAGALTVLMISHKFHEVMAFADRVSVLRKGRLAGEGAVAALNEKDMAAMMIGDEPLAGREGRAPTHETAPVLLHVRGLKAKDRTGLKSLTVDDLRVKAKEIVGIAGISGNGQKELLEVLANQRPMETGAIVVKGKPWHGRRAEARVLNLRFIPEEPLANACAPAMSVADNLNFRLFDRAAAGRSRFWLDTRQMLKHARALVNAFAIKAPSLFAQMRTLSGGNVQRAVLARELFGRVDVLIASNPCFGLDFAAVAEIRARIMAARNAGAAVLLLSEDLDELLELCDRIFVMSDGALVYETPLAGADIKTIGAYMAGHHTQPHG